jgi:hypothetical protein
MKAMFLQYEGHVPIGEEELLPSDLDELVDYSHEGRFMYFLPDKESEDPNLMESAVFESFFGFRKFGRC